MSSQKPTEFSVNNRLLISKMALIKMLLLSLKVSNKMIIKHKMELLNLNNLLLKAKTLHKEKFQDRKLNKYKLFKMKSKKFTILKEILLLQKFRMKNLKKELI